MISQIRVHTFDEDPGSREEYETNTKNNKQLYSITYRNELRRTSLEQITEKDASTRRKM